MVNNTADHGKKRNNDHLAKLFGNEKNFQLIKSLMDTNN